MLIDVAGDEDFVSKGVTGGLTLKAYTSKHYSDIFDEMMSEKDGTNLNHELLQGFSLDKDNRGYVSQSHINNVLVHAFAARKDNVTAYKLVSRSNFLEGDARQRE